MQLRQSNTTLSKVAIVTTLEDINAYSLNCLSSFTKELKRQNVSVHIACGFLNQIPEPKFLEGIDQTVLVYGNPLLFQREAMRNAVTRQLPKEVIKLVFADPYIVPLTEDWIKRTCELLERRDVLLPFSELCTIPNLETIITAPQYLGKFPDPALNWKKEVYPDTAIAMRKSIWELHHGLPWRNGFTGRNGVREYFQYEAKRKVEVPYYLGSSEHRKVKVPQPTINMGFCPRKLGRLEFPQKGASYPERVMAALKARFSLMRDIFLNTSGGIELTGRGSRHLSILEKLKVGDISKPEKLNMRVEFIKEHELALVLGYIEDRCVAYWDLKSEPQQGFCYHDLKPTGITRLMRCALSKRSVSVSDA